MAWRGMAWNGNPRSGKAWLGRGTARQGAARLGDTWPGMAESSTDRQDQREAKNMGELTMTTFNFGQGEVPAHRHPNGGGWIANTADVDLTAYVAPTARVYDNAHIAKGLVWIGAYAAVGGNARIEDQAEVSGHAVIVGHARISDNARVNGHAVVSDHAKISGEAWVSGNNRVSGNAVIHVKWTHRLAKLLK